MSTIDSSTNLTDAEPVGVSPLDKLTTCLIELVQAMFQRTQDGTIESFAALQATIEQLKHGIIPDWFRAAFSFVLPDKIRGHSQQPRAKRLVEIDFSQLPPKQQEHFLSKVVGLKWVVNPDSNKRPHRRLMSGDNLLEGLQVVVWRWCHCSFSMPTTDVESPL
jgi:hypothetical protein